MAKITYDHWHELLGQDLYVSIGSRLFMGEFLGLRPLFPKEANGRQVEHAWAISTLAGEVYFDPDNAAVVVYTIAYHTRKRAAPSSAQLGNARAQKWIADAEQMIRQAHEVCTSASQWIQRSTARKALASSTVDSDKPQDCAGD